MSRKKVIHPTIDVGSKFKAKKGSDTICVIEKYNKAQQATYVDLRVSDTKTTAYGIDALFELYDLIKDENA